MHKMVAFCMLVVFTAFTFNKAVIVLDYFINTKAFALHCENKARPWLHCNGKCQMIKTVQKQSEHEQQHPEQKAENKSEVFFLQPSFSFQATSIFHHISFLDMPDASLVSGISNTCFHPPAS